jgi:GGDEF domain-containing protein
MISQEDGAPVAELMRRADVACYQAKHGGKGSVRMFESVVRAPD